MESVSVGGNTEVLQTTVLLCLLVSDILDMRSLAWFVQSVEIPLWHLPVIVKVPIIWEIECLALTASWVSVSLLHHFSCHQCYLRHCWDYLRLPRTAFFFFSLVPTYLKSFNSTGLEESSFLGVNSIAHCHFSTVVDKPTHTTTHSIWNKICTALSRKF